MAASLPEILRTYCNYVKTAFGPSNPEFTSVLTEMVVDDDNEVETRNKGLRRQESDSIGRNHTRMLGDFLVGRSF